jgi:hypothetical protein
MSNNSGVGFAGLLTVLFVGLKLTGFIAWSWWWVLSPIIISSAIALAFLTVFLAAIFYRK